MGDNMRYRSLASAVMAGLLAMIVIAAISHTTLAAGAKRQYPYGSSSFTKFIMESSVECKSPECVDFYKWMEDAYAKFPVKKGSTLNKLISENRIQIKSISDRREKTRYEIELAAEIHKMVKATIPKFSLDRGFEFTNTMKYGERQCFLQSVLIAGLLQDMGVDAGVVMVYKNLTGDTSNNGHAVTLVKLPDGLDIIVDASEPEPFARHQGLFLDNNGYRYADPVFVKDSSRIKAYKLASSNQVIQPSHVRPLDYEFLRSQFYYYRGERTPGALLAAKPTPDGLQQAAVFLKKSVSICPQNPLAVYMLGRVYLSQGKTSDARKELQQANDLYASFGWVPQGPKDFLAASKK
jgi:hypothetical protein